MSYNFYSFLHLISLLGLALILGALWGLYTNESYSRKTRSILLSLHGLAMFLILSAGFGLTAKIKLDFPWPLWIYIKIALWFILGALPFLIKKSGKRFSSSSPKLYGAVLLFVFLLFVIGVFCVKL